jgi:hypothetical protein
METSNISLFRRQLVENALVCAVEMQMAMSKLNDVNRSMDMHDLFTGIAIKNGSVVVGDLDS